MNIRISGCPDENAAVVVQSDGTHSQAKPSKPQNAPVIPANGKPTTKASTKRKLSLPVVTSPLASQLHFAEHFYYRDQQKLFDTVNWNCLHALGYFVVLFAHLIILNAYHHFYMAFAFGILITIDLSIVVWVYSVSLSLALPDFHERLRQAVTVQIVIFVIFSISSLAFLSFITSVYLSRAFFKKLVLWKAGRFVYINGSLALLEFILSLINVVVACRCRRQLNRMSIRSRMVWGISSCVNAANDPRHKQVTADGRPTCYIDGAAFPEGDATVYYLDNITWAESLNMDSVEFSRPPSPHGI